MSVAQATNRSVRWEPSETREHGGDMVVTRGDVTDVYQVTMLPTSSRFMVTRISRTGDLHTASGRDAANRHETYMCSPSAKACTCAAGSFALMRGNDSNCVHVLALTKLIAIGAIINPLERPDADVGNTELSEQEPECDASYDPMLDDDFSHLVMMQGYVELA